MKTEPDTKLGIFADGEETPVEWAPVEGGRSAQLTITTATTSVEVRAERQGVDRWRLPVVVRTRPKAILEAEALARTGRLDQSERALAALADTTDPRIAGDVEIRRAAIAGARGDDLAAIGYLQRSAELADQSGVLSRSVFERLSIAFYAISRHDSATARQALEHVSRLPLRDFAPGRANAAYYEGVLAKELGDYRTALRDLESAAVESERLGLTSTRRFAIEARSTVLTGLGMVRPALAELGALEEEHLDGCSRAFLLSNRMWSVLWARELGEPMAEEVTRDGERALELFSGPCAKPNELPNIVANLALDAVQRGAFEEAAAYARQAWAMGDRVTPRVKLWLVDIEGRIALSNRSYDRARAAYQRLGRLSEETASVEGAWRAEVGRAQVELAMGRPGEALTAFANAEARLDQQSLGVSIGGDLSSFVAARTRVAQAQIDLLVREKRLEEAIAVSRRSRARVVRALRRGYRLAELSGDARARWEDAVGRFWRLRDRLDRSVGEEWTTAESRRAERQDQRERIEREIRRAFDDALSALPADRAGALGPPPGDDEVILGYQRVPDGWIGFASAPGEVRVVRVRYDGSSSTTALSRALLEPFARELDRSHRVRLLVAGPIAGIDLHALPWRGAPLVRSHVVTYGVDVSPSRTATTSEARAVVAADPLGDLPSAREEAANVRSRLEASGIRVALLTHREATRAALIDQMKGARLLHYAGHGEHRGAAGWESVLPLADGVGLTVGDILALPFAPEAVVLSGCDTSATAGEPGGQQLGLAEAFILAGAGEVVAASRPVRDEDAKAIVDALYAHRSSSLAEALRLAQLEIRARTPEIDWAAFRVLVP